MKSKASIKNPGKVQLQSLTLFPNNTKGDLLWSDTIVASCRQLYFYYAANNFDAKYLKYPMKILERLFSDTSYRNENSEDALIKTLDVCPSHRYQFCHKHWGKWAWFFTWQHKNSNVIQYKYLAQEVLPLNSTRGNQDLSKKLTLEVIYSLWHWNSGLCLQQCNSATYSISMIWTAIWKRNLYRFQHLLFTQSPLFSWEAVYFI